MNFTVTVENNCKFNCRFHFIENNKNLVGMRVDSGTSRNYPTKFNIIHVKTDTGMVSFKNNTQKTKVPFKSIQIYFGDNSLYHSYKFEYEQSIEFPNISGEDTWASKIKASNSDDDYLKPNNNDNKYINKNPDNDKKREIKKIDYENEDIINENEVDNPNYWRVNPKVNSGNINKKEKIEETKNKNMNNNEKLKSNSFIINKPKKTYDSEIHNIERMRDKKIVDLKKDLLDIEYEFKSIGVVFKYEIIEQKSFVSEIKTPSEEKSSEKLKLEDNNGSQ